MAHRNNQQYHGGGRGDHSVSPRHYDGDRGNRGSHHGGGNSSNRSQNEAGTYGNNRNNGNRNYQEGGNFNGNRSYRDGGNQGAGRTFNDGGSGNRNYREGGNHVPNRTFTEGGNRGGFGRGRGDSARGRGGPRPPAKPHVLCGEGAIFPVKVNPGSKAWRYNVSMEYTSQKFNGELITTSLTKEKRDTRTRALCYRILSVVMRDTNDFGVEGIQIAYDNMNSLYSNKPFTNVSYNVTKDQLATEQQQLLKGNGEVTVIIAPNEEMEFVDISDFSQYQGNDIILDEDQTVRQLLEIILSQGAINSGQYDVVGNGQLYRYEEKPIGRGLCTRIGTQKGIRIVESEAPNNAEEKQVCPGLIIDFKCSPFYSVGKNLLDRVKDFVSADSRNPRVYEDASKFFNGIKVCPVYDRHRVLVVKNFDERTLNEIKFKLDDGQEITLPEFYRTKKHIRLNDPHSRAVNVAGDKGQFPMELLLILPNQRVSLEKVSSYLRDQVHRLNAVLPQQRYENIIDEVVNMDFNNEVTKGFGIHVSYEPFEKASALDFFRPPKPKIVVGGNVEISPAEDGRFDLGRNKYFLPCTINRWAVVYGYDCDSRLIDGFKDAFKKSAMARGIQFKDTVKDFNFDSKNATFKEWQNLFKTLKDNGVTFVILLDSKSITHSHGILKMMESVTKILTQHVTVEVASKVVDQHQHLTLGNILMKVNVKNGGLNYVVKFNNANRLDVNKQNVLVFGYDVAHPTGVSQDEKKENIEKGHVSETRDPSVVGITANVISDPSAFIGNFFYQPTCQEKVDKNELRIYIRQFLNKLKENKRKLPEIVVILRDGVSEGQFKMTYKDELPAIREGFKDYDPSYEPKFVFVVCTKRHHKRFFEGEKGEFSNPQAGSFVENKFTRPDIIEFFMQSHKAIKGTSKFVQCSVVLNEPEVTKKELFSFLHSLSYGHQIVCSPVSLPTPIYQADELAARGAEVYHSVKENIPNAIKWENGEIKYYELSALLNYSDTALGNRRFNA